MASALAAALHPSLDLLNATVQFVPMLLPDASNELGCHRGVLDVAKLFPKYLKRADITLRHPLRPNSAKEFSGVAQLLDADAQAMQFLGTQRANAAAQFARSTVSRVEFSDGKALDWCAESMVGTVRDGQLLRPSQQLRDRGMGDWPKKLNVRR